MSELSQVLGVLAHELRTPIAAILGYQELLADGIYGEVDERGKEPLSRIAYAARQLLHLIDGVQEISDPASRLTTQSARFEPVAVIRDCIKQVSADAAGRGVQLELSVPDALPEMQGDAERFCRAVDLALAAAIKASHGATLIVRASGHDGELNLTIAQTGLSPQRDTPDLTGPFPPGAGLTGSGLRLAIVRHIVRQMRGKLELQTGDMGTTLLLSFSTD